LHQSSGRFIQTSTYIEQFHNSGSQQNLPKNKLE